MEKSDKVIEKQLQLVQQQLGEGKWLLGELGAIMRDFAAAEQAREQQLSKLVQRSLTLSSYKPLESAEAQNCFSVLSQYLQSCQDISAQLAKEVNEQICAPLSMQFGEETVRVLPQIREVNAASSTLQKSAKKLLKAKKKYVRYIQQSQKNYATSEDYSEPEKELTQAVTYANSATDYINASYDLWMRQKATRREQLCENVRDAITKFVIFNVSALKNLDYDSKNLSLRLQDLGCKPAIVCNNEQNTPISAESLLRVFQPVDLPQLKQYLIDNSGEANRQQQSDLEGFFEQLDIKAAFLKLLNKNRATTTKQASSPPPNHTAQIQSPNSQPAAAMANKMTAEEERPRRRKIFEELDTNIQQQQTFPQPALSSPKHQFALFQKPQVRDDATEVEQGFQQSADEAQQDAI